MGRTKTSFNLLLKIWPLGKLQRWAARQPVLKHFIHMDVDQERNHHVIVPVNEVLRGSESILLPPLVLEQLITRASLRTALNACPCRKSDGCARFPMTIGCLFLGDAAGQIDPALGKPLTVEAAHEHYTNAISIGLLPMIVHSAFDAELLGIDYHRMLAICFCCPCCCSVQQSLRKAPPEYRGTVQRFPGLHVVVMDNCSGCEACLAVCPVEAIEMQSNRAVIGEGCKGCGRCALLCPDQAIELGLEDENSAMQTLMKLVEQRTQIVPTNPSS